MADPYLQGLANGRLIDAGKPAAPAGKRPAAPKRDEGDDQRAKAERHAKRANEQRRLESRLDTLLAHYATTDTDPRDIRRHLGVGAIVDVLKARKTIKRGMTDQDKAKAIDLFVVDGLRKHGRRIDPTELEG